VTQTNTLDDGTRAGQSKIYKETDLLDYLHEHTRENTGDPVTASEVADALGWPRRRTLDILTRLADTDLLDTKKVGARARVWWVPTDVDLPDDIDDIIDMNDSTTDGVDGGTCREINDRVDEESMTDLADEFGVSKSTIYYHTSDSCSHETSE